MAAMLDGVAALLAFGLIFWIAFGGQTRRRERQADRHSTDARRPRRGWFAPSRDKPVYTPGLLLLLVAIWQIAGLIESNSDAGAYLISLVVFSVIVTIGFSIRPDLVGAGLGLAGTTCQLLGRFHPSGCPIYTFDDRRTYWILSGTVVALLVGARIFVAPVRGVGRFTTGTTNLLFSRGRPRELGVVASTLLAIVGALDLVDLATQPDVLVGLRSSGFGLSLIAATAVAAMAVLAGLATLPAFTLSVLGLGVIGANIVVAATSTAACERWTVRIAIAISLLLTNRLASRLIQA